MIGSSTGSQEGNIVEDINRRMTLGQMAVQKCDLDYIEIV